MSVKEKVSSEKYLGSLFSLENKTSIVTGAAGYFGKAFSESLLSSGAKVVLFARGEKIKKLSSELTDSFGSDKVDYYDVDFYQEDVYRDALNDVVKSNETVDVLVNNSFDFSKDTGFNDPSGTVKDMNRSQWMKSLESGIYWHTVATQVVAEQMKKQKSGSIVNISSMYGIVSPGPDLYEGSEVLNPPSYTVSKSALIAFTKYVAAFYGEYGVRCNAIAPGPFPNIDPESYNSPQDEKFMQRLKDKTVLGRTGKLEELLGALIYLASDASSYVTGQSVVVDGGWTVR